jgi:hypothetical protein
MPCTDKPRAAQRERHAAGADGELEHRPAAGEFRENLNCLKRGGFGRVSVRDVIELGV